MDTTTTNDVPSASSPMELTSPDTPAPKRVLVVCQLDRFANGPKPLHIQEFLHSRGHHVRVFDTYFLTRTSTRSGRALYLLHAAFGLLTRTFAWARKHLSYHLYRLDWHFRRKIFADQLDLDEYDLVICETPYDAPVLTIPTTAKTLYDCPTPWADELYLESRLTRRQHAAFRRREARIFEEVDHLAFHWETYARYAVEHYGISGRNLITLNYGCTPSDRRASFRTPLRIVYIGWLSYAAIDLPFLSRLTKLYPHIDVYGGPPPDPKLGLNYKGYATLAVLEHYQVGLVTCTQDTLRREGFSAKHPQYFAYGLPVLVPRWRRNLELLDGSVTYDEETFLDTIEVLTNETSWTESSDAAYKQAQALAWDVTLRPLETILDS